MLDVYHALVLARAAEERLEALHEQGHVPGSLYRSLGQEAGAVGAAYALRRKSDGTGDVLAHSSRAIGAVFAMGGDPLDFFRQCLARSTGPTGGREAGVHWGDPALGLVSPVAPLGTMLQVMAGITLSFRIKGEDRVGLVFSGDGASSTGAWHEGLALAAAQRCPMVLMVEANQRAFSSPTSTNTRVKSFTEKAAGYGLHAEAVDGTDVLAVIDATRAAVERAREGQGAGMVELRYYRRAGYAQHDAQEYVDPQELKVWEERDPTRGFRDRLLAERWATQQELEAAETRARDTVEEAAERALLEPVPRGHEAVAAVCTDVPAARPWTRLSENGGAVGAASLPGEAAS